ncbi:putative polyketide synthase 29 [Cytospora mali]|uniref:Polyketide synthase 29 n=1 Tax=Cytospora mali TaxID=578113 RepID=A0A194VYY8_CYTMA|nr:putative polyketide synthase 29 [Valsa mali]
MARPGHGFQRPRIDLIHRENDEPLSIDTLPDLIRFNAQYNPNHSFCKQAELHRASNTPDALEGQQLFRIRDISMQELNTALQACVGSLGRLIGYPQHTVNGHMAPVALCMESNVGLFIYLAALLELEIPVLLLSTRLSPSSIRHLLKETGAQTILLSPRLQSSLGQELDGIANALVTDPYVDHVCATPVNGNHSGGHRSIPSIDPGKPLHKARLQHPLILHSSGTTGLPKPIPVSGRYPLVYAACHEFPDDMAVDWANMSTLPLYHGFGLLAPCLSLSVGLSCCFPPSSIIPSAQSTIDLLEAFSAGSLMTVPSIMDDLLALSQQSEIPGPSNVTGLLRDLRFVAIGGGALNSSTASVLAEQGIKLLLHYGVTELGALAPIFCPGPDYDWHYVRLRTDFGLSLEPITEPGTRNGFTGVEQSGSGGQRFKLVGCPVGSDQRFEIQDEMLKNNISSRVEVRLLGRRDDLIVLKTGEKVVARLIEDTLMADENVSSAVCVGDGYFELVVIVQPSPSTVMDEVELINHIWGLVQKINPLLDQHARISSRAAIILKPPSKTIPRSDKGSVMRKEVHDLFKTEIEAAYANLDLELSPSVSLDMNNVEQSIVDMLQSVSGLRFSQNVFGADDDFFENGMDSLQSVRLARLINAAIGKGANMRPNVSAEYIYRHPTIRLLSNAVKLLYSGNEKTPIKRDRAAEMRCLVEDFSEDKPGPPINTRLGPLDLTAAEKPHKGNKKVVLLTGSTGNLGAHVLSCLCRDQSVSRVFCLLRPKKVGSDSQSENPERPIGSSNSEAPTGKAGANSAYERQNRALSDAGIQLSKDCWDKIRLLEGTRDVAATDLGLCAHQLSQIARSAVTHVIHMAWPMDFNRTLQSFTPHIRAVQSLVRLARSAHSLHPPHTPPVRLLFTSSIAVLRNHDPNDAQGLGVAVPETAASVDPLLTAEMGYAEAKWVCEQMLLRAGRQAMAEIETMTVRVGQLSGPERDGVWKTEEHIPALLRASQTISMFPRLKGNMSWLPVDRAAKSLVEVLFQPGPVTPEEAVFHLENPIRQSSQDFVSIARSEMGMSDTSTVVGFDEWVDQVTKAGCAPSLVPFFRHHFQALASGSVILGTTRARRSSRTLRGISAISKDLMAKYIGRWKKAGFLEP